MIPVQPKAAPADFVELVANPGAEFLKSCPKPRHEEWKGKEYWRKVLPDLTTAYDETCAYTAFRIPKVVGSSTVEHFVPRSVDASKAYVWSNFRLVCGKHNTNRPKNTTILDPFEIREGTFALVFPSLEVIHGALGDNDPALASAVKETCKILKLNVETGCIAWRREYLHKFWEGRISFKELQTQAPFLARELVRQDLDDRKKIGAVMSFERPSPKQA